MKLSTVARALLGVLLGVLTSGAFLIAIFRVWEPLVTPYPIGSGELRRTLVLFTELGFYCIAGLIFGVVNALIAPKGGIGAVVAAVLVFISLLPLTFMEGYFVPPLIIIPLMAAIGSASFVHLGQMLVSARRK